MKNVSITIWQKLSLIMILFIFAFGITLDSVHAYTVEDLFGKVDQGDIVISGGKTELVMSPGEYTTFTIAFSNRLGKSENFKITTEDLGISSDEEALPGSATGKDISPYSIKDYIKPEVSELTLDNMKKVRMPVTVTIPADTRAGSLSGAVVFSLKDPVEKETKDGGKIAIENRLAYRVYVKIKGNEKEDGYLKSFGVDKKFQEYGPVPLKFKFENDGNIYLVPSGTITVKNMLGITVEKIDINKYYVQPETIKTSIEQFKRKYLIGKYTAKIELNRGYANSEDVTDSKTISFWVVPWKLLLIIFVIVVLLVWLSTIIMSKYKIAHR